MGVLKNDVGRPSNKTIRARFILKVVLVMISFVIGYLFAIYVVPDKESKDYVNHERTCNASKGDCNEKNHTVEETDNNKKEDVTTTKVDTNKKYNPKEAFDKFVKTNNLITITNDEKMSLDSKPIYDMEALKKDNCVSATWAQEDGSVDVYHAELLTFTDEESAKKYFKSQVEGQKANEEVVKVYEKNILTDRTTEDYSVFEMIRVAEDFYGTSEKVYDYLYMVRIDNYYITLFNSNSYAGMVDGMVNLKEALNVLLQI